MKTFGFSYQMDGRSYMTDVVATTQDEAERKLREAMANAVCVGEICHAPPEPPRGVDRILYPVASHEQDPPGWVVMAAESGVEIVPVVVG